MSLPVATKVDPLTPPRLSPRKKRPTNPQETSRRRLTFSNVEEEEQKEKRVEIVAQPQFKRLKEEQRHPLISDGNFHCGLNNYPIKKIGSGKFHAIYGFEKNMLKLPDGQQIDLSQVVLRTVSPQVIPKKIPQVLKNDDTAYQYMCSNNIPLPEVFFKGETSIDPLNPSNGGFWLIERMKESISIEGWAGENNQKTLDQLAPKDRKVLEFAKGWLTKMAETKSDLINDFYPRNVMWDKEGELKVVDFTEPQKGWLNNLKSYLKKWSNGNKEVEAYLKKDMPKEVLEQL